MNESGSVTVLDIFHPPDDQQQNIFIILYIHKVWSQSQILI